MKMRARRRRRAEATAAFWVAFARHALAMQEAHERGCWPDDDSPPDDLACDACWGTGGDRWNDGVTPCQYCDGEGFRWWQ